MQPDPKFDQDVTLFCKKNLSTKTKIVSKEGQSSSVNNKLGQSKVKVDGGRILSIKSKIKMHPLRIYLLKPQLTEVNKNESAYILY